MRSRNVVIGLVSSVVVLALAVGLLLLLDSVGDDDLQLPERAGDLVALDTAAGEAVDDGPVAQEAVDRVRAGNDVERRGLSDAFDGAASDVRVYGDTAADDPTGLLLTATAVAADAGPLVPLDGFVDPAQLGLALPPVERVTDGDVECLLVRSSPPRAGTSYQPDQATPDSQVCQRRSGSLTVRVRSDGGDTDAVVAAVDLLWDELD